MSQLPTRESFDIWQAAVHQNSRAKGFWDDLDPDEAMVVLGKIALMHSELSEAVEEERAGKRRIYFNLERPGKPEGLVVELADCIIRIMDLCEALHLDLYAAMRLKHEYNTTRPHMHGKMA